MSEIVNVILLLCVSMDLFGTDRNQRNESDLSLPYVADLVRPCYAKLYDSVLCFALCH